MPELLAMARAPQTSTTSGTQWQRGSETQTPEAQAVDKALEGLTRAGHEELLGRPELAPGYLEGIARGGAQQIRTLQEGLANRAALTGGGSPADAALDAILAGSGIIGNVKSQIAEAPMLAEQIKTGRLRGAQAFLDPRLQRRRQYSSRGGSTSRTVGSPSISGMLAAHQFGAPQRPDVILPV
jgi:hypothetical protein